MIFAVLSGFYKGYLIANILAKNDYFGLFWIIY